MKKKKLISDNISDQESKYSPIENENENGSEYESDNENEDETQGLSGEGLEDLLEIPLEDSSEHHIDSVIKNSLFQNLKEDIDPSQEILDGTELESFESAEIEDLEILEDQKVESILESVLFASDRPISLASLRLLFKGTNIKGDKVKKIMDRMMIDLAGGHRGISLEEVVGGYQIRTKVENLKFITRSLKTRPFRVSGPALEVLAIVAYRQPLIKHEIDEIRGVESGHLLRALMEKNLVQFEGKSELPGKPMYYGTTKKFLEIFGLRNLKELPTLSQIDELIPEGIGEEDFKEKSTLSQLTDSLSEKVSNSYSEGEEELFKISNQLEQISITSTFFEEEKRKEKEKKEAEKAEAIREALMLGQEVVKRDLQWLARYDEALVAAQSSPAQTSAAGGAAEAAGAESSTLDIMTPTSSAAPPQG